MKFIDLYISFFNLVAGLLTHVFEVTSWQARGRGLELKSRSLLFVIGSLAYVANYFQAYVIGMPVWLILLLTLLLPIIMTVFGSVAGVGLYLVYIAMTPLNLAWWAWELPTFGLIVAEGLMYFVFWLRFMADSDYQAAEKEKGRKNGTNK